MIAELTDTTITNQSRGSKASRVCTACGHTNPNRTSRCLNCSAPLATGCPTCGHPAPSGSKFCGECGTSLADKTASTTPNPRHVQIRQQQQYLVPTALAQKAGTAAPDMFAEYREVTVLFVGIAAAGKTGETDEEDLYFARNTALKFLGQVVQKYEGTVDKFTQTGLMALFGAPVAHENDPERAVRAALDMQRLLQPWQLQLKEETGIDLNLSIGLNTGPVVAGKVGSEIHMDYTVVGDTVKLAGRLETWAEAGTIVLGQETQARVRSLFECGLYRTAFDPVTSQSVRSYQLLGPRSRPEAARWTLAPQLPIIGRAAELASLKEALAEVKQHERSRVALITGEAGVGKSRLVAEFKQDVDQTGCKIFAAGCLAYSRAVPLGLIANLLRNILQIAETMSPQLQQEKLVQHLVFLELADHEILPYLLLVLGLPQSDPAIEKRLQLLDAAMLQRQTHAALRQFLMATASRQTTVLIFEDLHQLDPASRNFLEYFIQSSEDAALLILLISRAAERDTILRSLVTLAEQDPEQWLDLELQPLSETEAQRLIDQIIPATHPDAWLLKQQVVTRSSGNPFFLEELVRMLIDQDGLNRDPESGAWRVTAHAQTLMKTVPSTVRGLIMARFDRLPEGLRRTLQKAAVFGPAFPLDLLQTINEPAPEVTAAQLEALTDRQFLAAQPFRATSGYAFYHTLLQETIYETLIKRDRQKVHTQVAQVIELSALWLPEEQAEVLAYHFAESTFPLRAVPHLLTAGDNAARRCAYETAINHFRRAKGLLPSLPADQGDAFFRARLGLGTALKFTGGLKEASQVLKETLEKLWQSTLATTAENLQAILIEALRQLADIRQREGSYEAALAYLTVGLQLLEDSAVQSQTAAPRARLLDRTAWIHFRRGALDEALSTATTAIESLLSLSSEEATEAGDPITLASLYNTLGGIAWQQDRLESAIDHVERSLGLYDEIGYLYGAATAYGNLGILYYQQGQWPRAINYYEQAYAVHRVIGNRDGQAISLDNLGLLYLASGDHQRAQQEFEAALAIRQRLGDTWGTAQTQINLGHLHLAQAQFGKATSRVRLALSLARTIGSPEIQVEGLWLRALLYAEEKQLAAGIKAAEEALKTALKAGLSQKTGDCMRVLGTLRRREGQFDQAETLLQQALSQAQERNDPYLQGRVWLELGWLYQDQARPEAPVAFETAAGLFEQLGASHHLQQASAALA